MKIGILTHNPAAYSHIRLAAAGAERGHDIRMISTSYCYMKISATEPEVYYRHPETFENLDAIIPRISPKHTLYATAILRQFEMQDVYTPNSAVAITWSRDKLRLLQILAKKGLPLPITGVADSPQESEKLIEVVGGPPLIVKILDGTEGKGTIFAETQQAALSVINAFKHLKANILVQQFIDEARGVDIRCLVIGNKVVGAIQRTATEPGIHGHYATPNHSDKTCSVKMTLQEKKLAVKAAKALKLNLASVDLIRSKQGPLILDLNPSPSFETIEKVCKIDIAHSMLQFIEENVGKPDHSAH
jgi:ribosomal protein S6--L-glutamate ligase